MGLITDFMANNVSNSIAWVFFWGGTGRSALQSFLGN